jgi:sugar O-acyltransferase (sialic acid O-acetyltransferase NeuD family)
MKTRVVGLGAGGHAKGIIEILRLNQDFEIVGLLDPKQELHGLDILGVPVMGGDNLLPKLKQEGVQHFFIGLGGVGDNSPRRDLFEMAIRHELSPVDVIHPQAIISPSAVVGAGCVILAGAVVNSSARIGENVILNTNAVLEHDCDIENHAHIATGAILAGAVHVADAVHIGVGAVVKQSISIGRNAIVGAGAVVVKDVRPNTIVVGVPAKEITRSEKN